MPQIEVSEIVEFSDVQMIALVRDVANYGNFLPWIKAVKIWDLAEDNNSFNAELLVGYRNFRAPFSTAVEVMPQSNQIVTNLIENRRTSLSLFAKPMKKLECKWQFIAIGSNCQVKVCIDYEFSDLILAALLKSNMDKAISKLINGFTEEAKLRYKIITN